MPTITPFLWFEKDAKDAVDFYLSVFKENAKIIYSTGLSDTPSGDVQIYTIELLGQRFTLMNAGPFRKFNEAISFVINCNTQEEVDYYWEKLSADKAGEQCAWLKDRYGVSWQVVPELLQELLNSSDKVKSSRAQQAMLIMKKIDMAALQRAYDGIV